MTQSVRLSVDSIPSNLKNRVTHILLLYTYVAIKIHTVATPVHRKQCLATEYSEATDSS